MVSGTLPVGQESLILPSYAWTCRVGQPRQEPGMAMARVEAAAYVADHSISTSLTDPVRPLACGRSRAESSTPRPTDRPTASGALADTHRRLRPSRCWILLRRQPEAGRSGVAAPLDVRPGRLRGHEGG